MTSHPSMNYYSEEEIYRTAQKRVKKKKGFYIHFGVYLAMGCFFFVMNLVEFDGEIWFFMPMIPWGVSIMIHYFAVFGLPGGAMSKEWEEAEMAKELERQRRLRGTTIVPHEEPDPDEELELKEFKQLRREWDDKDFV